MHTRPPQRCVVFGLLLMLGQGVITSRATAQTLTIATNPATLSVTTAVAGSEPNASAEDASTGYTAVILLGTTKRIVAKLSSPLPAGVTLKVKLEATAGASGSTSAGYVDLDIADRTVLSTLAGGALGATYIGSISYTLVSTVAATPFTNTVVDVVFSIVNP